MSKTVEDAIAELTAEIGAAESDLRKKKETVNTLCGVVGRPPAYSLQASQETAIPTAIRPDQFYGQPLASSVRVILEMRRAANLGAGSINELYDALMAGGYVFETKSEDIARKSLRNSLAKNTIFHRLPNGRFGMRTWYPNIKEARTSPSAEDAASEDVAPEEEGANGAAQPASPEATEQTVEDRE